MAVRRTCLFIIRFASLFPANNLSLIEHGFKWIEQEATPIRDLDIYMSLFDDFESRVDADHRQALISLYVFLQEQKKRDLRRMRISLNSPRYYKLIESWSGFLLSCENRRRLPKDGKAPIGVLARDRIQDIYRQFVKKSKKLSNDAGVKEICELHQVSKQLGYHLEVFSSLFPEKKIARLLKFQIRLQSSLNQFRDMNLQYSRLKEYKSGMKKAQAVRKISLEAVEQLIADRKSEKVKARTDAIKHIKRFTRRKMRKRFKSILSTPVE
jgi:CHAD domain-containing protein